MWGNRKKIANNGDKAITEKGCEFCTDRAPWNFRCDVRRPGKDGRGEDVSVPVHLCPNCGRRL